MTGEVYEIKKMSGVNWMYGNLEYAIVRHTWRGRVRAYLLSAGVREGEWATSVASVPMKHYLHTKEDAQSIVNTLRGQHEKRE